MHRTVTILVLLVLALPSLSQDTLSYAQQLKAIEDEMDSLTIFNLIDSLFSLDISSANELNVRVSFTTNVTSAGRDYDISQSGVSTGLSYYHKSGFYGDLAGYWNSGVDPNYNPTVLSAGFLGNFKNPKWSYAIDGERWFYNPKDSSNNPLKYSLGSSLSYDFKLGFVSIDYSFLFGNATANRIITNLTGTINLGKWWIFKSVSIYPSISMMAGNSDITQLRITNEQVSDQTANRIRRLTSFANLTDQQRRFLVRMVFRAHNDNVIDLQTRNELLIDIRNAEDLSPSNIAALETIVNEGYEVTEFFNRNKFGVLNYALTFPISMSTNRINVLLSYTYSIPVQLPGEFVEVDPLGYFGVSLSYRIPFK